jgi:hypothetical protein
MRGLGASLTPDRGDTMCRAGTRTLQDFSDGTVGVAREVPEAKAVGGVHGGVLTPLHSGWWFVQYKSPGRDFVLTKG